MRSSRSGPSPVRFQEALPEAYPKLLSVRLLSVRFYRRKDRRALLDGLERAFQSLAGSALVRSPFPSLAVAALILRYAFPLLGAGLDSDREFTRCYNT